MRVKDRRDSWHILSPTAEEVVVDVVRGELSSARQLPIALWQCGTKWRDEARARGGPLRGREFLMKDAYSFHATAECVERWYQTTCEAYARIFTRLCPEGSWCKARGSSGTLSLRAGRCTKLMIGAICVGSVVCCLRLAPG
jgi:prolyl-tRNA synthetase